MGEFEKFMKCEDHVGYMSTYDCDLSWLGSSAAVVDDILVKRLESVGFDIGI